MAGQIVEPVEEIIHRSHGDLGSWLPSPGLPVPAPWTCYVANPKYTNLGLRINLIKNQVKHDTCMSPSLIISQNYMEL